MILARKQDFTLLLFFLLLLSAGAHAQDKFGTNRQDVGNLMSNNSVFARDWQATPSIPEPIVFLTLPNPTITDCDYSSAAVQDGWGWNPNTGESCPPITTEQHTAQNDCDYTNAALQDGWGWNPQTLQSCAPVPSAAEEGCDYSEAERHGGWGWDPITRLSCPPLSSHDLQNAVCIDTDGDGWGWDGTTSCLANDDLVTTPATNTDQQNEIESKVAEIRGEYGIQIHYDYNPETYFPSRWLDAPISARGGQLPIDEISRLLLIVDEFILKYPKRVLENNLVDIFLSAELNFYGLSYGGTYNSTGIYIKSEGINAGYTDSFLQQTMHAEFSSILMRNHVFPENEWSMVNAEDFQYRGTGVEMLGEPDLFGQSPELLSQGFIVRYAQSSLENDFNMIVHYLFEDQNNLRQIANQYPRIKAKMDLAIGFYQSIDSSFFTQAMSAR